MAEVGTALAIVAFADQCIKYGEKLVRRCQAYRHAAEEAQGLLLIIEHNWIKTKAQITILSQISDTLDTQYRDVQTRVLSEFEGKLKTATLTMDQLIAGETDKEFDFRTVAKALGKMAPMKKVKYALKKEALEKIIEDLESWQRRFDPSWMLIIRMTDDKIDQQLDQEWRKPKQTEFIMAAKGVRDAARESSLTLVPDGSIFISPDPLSSEETPIPFCSATLCPLIDTKEHVLVDTMICNPIADMTRTTKDVRKLARILSKVDPITFGLLACRGVVKAYIDDDRAPNAGGPGTINAFKFLFSIPPSLKSPPKSLRTLLIESDPVCPLNSRFDLAKQLTNSVLFVHSSQFVHKNIRPETILVFGNDTAKIGSSFLVGFEKFRPAEGMTYRTSDGIWQHDLYRHPSRQGTQPEEDYQMPHDIYSLGVVLLELGLWQSFLSFPPPFPPSSTPSLDNPTISPALTAALGLDDPDSEPKDGRKRAQAVKNALMALAEEVLPAKMGQRYADVVLLCLGCLDGAARGAGVGAGAGAAAAVWSGNDGDEEGGSGGGGAGGVEGFVDEDGIVVGVRYIERILLRMQEISI